MKKISALLGIVLVFILFGRINIASAADANTPKVDFSIKASQSVIVKPQGQNAQGNLDVHLTPSGMSTSANRDPIDLIFIFDKSGSMDESVNGIKKIQSAKIAMTQAVNFFKNNAGPRDRFAFISFSSDVEQVVNFSPTTGSGNLDLINQTANSLSAVGGTNYTQSFEKAINLFGGSENNKYIIFMTDGDPTFSINEEPVTYSKKVQTGTKKVCFIICWDEPVYETRQVTENFPFHYELYGSGSSMSNLVYYYDVNGNKTYNKNITVPQTKTSIRNHGVAMANQLAQKNIKLFSIGFGSSADVDMGYLNNLSSLTGVPARQANSDNIANIFQDISKDIATPAIDAEVRIDLSKFNGKVNLLDGSIARMEGNVAVLKTTFNYPIGQTVNQPIDVSLPFSFSDIATYTFDNIKLYYKNLDGTTIPLTHAPVSIEVKADAPSSFKGTMGLTGITNTVDNLIKVSNQSQTTNQFNVTYSLEPFGLVNNLVSGSLSSLKLIQPLPDGVSLIASTGVKSITYNGKPAAQIDLTQTINYLNGTFTPSKATTSLKLQADWAISNNKMPNAILQYKDSRFTTSQETTIPASNQSINMKVRLNEFPSNVYDGDALGIITKSNDSTKNIIAQTEFPNDYSLKNKAIKEMIFVPGSFNKVIEVTYFDGDSVRIYLEPDFQLIGQTTGQFYSNRDTSNEFVDIKLSKTVAGKDVKYYYSINQQTPTWTEFKANDSIPLTSVGLNTVKIKAVGGFALDGLIVEKTITIQRKVSSISANPASIEVEVGSTVPFTVDILPTDATNKRLEITIANAALAALADNTRILGVAEGDTELIVKTLDGSGLTVRIPVHVKDPYIALSEIKFKKAVFQITKGQKVAVDGLLIFNPANSTRKSIETVTSSMTDKVEVVKENGQWFIKGKDIGYSTVKAIAEEQKDGRKPNDSALFEVTNEENNSDNNAGSSGDGRW